MLALDPMCCVFSCGLSICFFFVKFYNIHMNILTLGETISRFFEIMVTLLGVKFAIAYVKPSDPNV
jgi:hypothetical protein